MYTVIKVSEERWYPSARPKGVRIQIISGIFTADENSKSHISSYLPSVILMLCWMHHLKNKITPGFKSTENKNT
jgi:hypothetical protein